MTTSCSHLLISMHCLALCLHLSFAFNGSAGEKGGEKAPLSNVGRRSLWTTSKIQGTPEPPPPYGVELAFPKLRFLRPGTLTNAPGSNRLFLVEVEGKIYSFPNDARSDKADLFFDVRSHVPKLSQAYGMTFHPKFAENRYVYLCYVLQGTEPDGTRISRFTVKDTEPPTVDPASEQIVITFLAGGHNGCCLKFGPDGYLYISTGDGTGPSPPDILKTGQDCSDLLSSILRIDVDHPEEGKHYRAPPDNPFLGTEGVRPEIWAFGFRNPWKMSFDQKSGDLWVGDVGWESWELVSRVQKGGNYGWSITEGDQPVFPDGTRGPSPVLPPTVQHDHSEARSITGGYVYHGSRLPELNGTYIYGDWSTGKIWALKHDGKQVESLRELVDSTLQVVDFAEDEAGELYILDYETTGQIYRLIRNPEKAPNAPFPRTLSATGLFDSVGSHKLAAGVIPYSINAPMWADGTNADRYLALPGADQLEFLANGAPKFPAGTVLMKTIHVPAEDPSKAPRRLETQILHFENDSWRPYSFVWDDSQTDANLVDASGSNVSYALPTRKEHRSWRIASRTECNLCHTPYLASVLAVNASQLNRNQRHGDKNQNQLEVWQAMGLLKTPLTKPAAELPRDLDPIDASASTEERARAYLHANCQHCHRPNGGGTSTIHLTAGIPLAEMQIANVAPALGTLGLRNGRVITPGDPYQSVLFLRMSKSGPGHMPHVGSRVVDDTGLQLIHDWIADMPKLAPEKSAGDKIEVTILLDPARPEVEWKAAVSSLLQNVESSLRLAYLFAHREIPKDRKQQVLQGVRAQSNPVVRDLFERFLPESQRRQRLGDSIDSTALLKHSGDSKRGRDLFILGTSVQCKSCHRIHGFGGEIGPDLSTIGKKYERAALLETILLPSKAIEAKYTTHVASTAAGEVYTGLLIEKTDGHVVLRSATGVNTKLNHAEIESLRPSAQSLMPEKLFRDLTAAEAVDLLEYLSSLR